MEHPTLIYRCSRCGISRHENVIATALHCPCGESFEFTCMPEIDGKAPSFKVLLLDNRDTLGCYVLPKAIGDLGSRDVRIKGAWLPEIHNGKLSIYVSCVRCGTINDLSDIRTLLHVGLDAVIDCFHCGECLCDHFIVLGDFLHYLYFPRKELNGNIVFFRGQVIRM